jgi:hypothetical protein
MCMHDNHTLQELEKQVQQEQEKAAKAIAASKQEARENSASYTPHTQQFQAIASCTLDAATAAYRIAVETPVPLDIVLLQASCCY